MVLGNLQSHPMSMFLFAIAAFVCEVIGTVGGFGSSAFFVPLAQFFLAFKVVLAVTALYHLASNAAKVLLFFRHIDCKISAIMGFPSVAFVAIGALLVAHVPARSAVIALAIFLIVFGIVFLALPQLKMKPTTTNAVILGGVAGFLAGFIGTGGAVRGAALSAFDLNKNKFVATSATIDLVVDATRSAIYLSAGFLVPEAYKYLPILLVVAFAGSYTGKLILERISQQRFRSAVLFLLIAVGVLMLVRLPQS